MIGIVLLYVNYFYFVWIVDGIVSVGFVKGYKVILLLINYDMIVEWYYFE